MTCLGRLVDQERCLFIVELNLGLVLFKLHLVQVLHLCKLRLVDLVHDATGLEPALEPECI